MEIIRKYEIVAALVLAIIGLTCSCAVQASAEQLQTGRARRAAFLAGSESTEGGQAGLGDALLRALEQRRASLAPRGEAQTESEGWDEEGAGTSASQAVSTRQVEQVKPLPGRITGSKAAQQLEQQFARIHGVSKPSVEQKPGKLGDTKAFEALFASTVASKQGIGREAAKSGVSAEGSQSALQEALSEELAAGQSNIPTPPPLPPSPTKSKFPLQGFSPADLTAGQSNIPTPPPLPPSSTKSKVPLQGFSLADLTAGQEDAPAPLPRPTLEERSLVAPGQYRAGTLVTEGGETSSWQAGPALPSRSSSGEQVARLPEVAEPTGKPAEQPGKLQQFGKWVQTPAGRRAAIGAGIAAGAALIGAGTAAAVAGARYRAAAQSNKK